MSKSDYSWEHSRHVPSRRRESSEGLHCANMSLYSCSNNSYPTILGARIVSEPRIKILPARLHGVSSPQDEEAIIEAKGVTPNTQQRLAAAVLQLGEYSNAYQEEFQDKEPT